MIVSLLYISAPEYHLQGVYDHKVSQVQHPISGINQPVIFNILKYYNSRIHKVDKYKPTFAVTPQIYKSELLRVEPEECIQASAKDHIYRGRFGAV